MEPAVHEVSQGVTIFFSIILLLMILSLALEEKIHAPKVSDRQCIRYHLSGNCNGFRSITIWRLPAVD